MAFFLSAIVLFLCGCTWVSDEGEGEVPLRVTVLDVGQGLAVLLEYDGRYGLYDSGPDSAGVADSLRARGVEELEWVVLSHNHRDHVGGFVELADAGIQVKKLFVGPDAGGDIWRDSVLYLAHKRSIPVDTLWRGDVVQLGSAGNLLSAEMPDIRVLWPPDYETVDGNHGSLVLNVSWGAGSALLTGDLDSLGERELLELSPTLAVDLLQVGHHGSAGSSGLAFLAQVAPEYAVVSVGAGNPYGHPAESVVQKFGYVLGDSLHFFRTDRDGSVSFVLEQGVGTFLDKQPNK
jgi:competence protein ComEC